MTRTVSQNKRLQPRSSITGASKKTKKHGVLLPEINLLQLLSGCSSRSCTVGGKSPYVPEEDCARVTLGSHNTMRREISLCFMKR